MDSKRVKLSEHFVNEKFNWLCDAVGDYYALEAVATKFEQPGIALERLVGSVELDDHEVVGEDMVAWYLEGSTGYEALEYWTDAGYDVEFAVDAAVSEAGADLKDAEDVYGAEDFQGLSRL